MGRKGKAGAGQQPAAWGRDQVHVPEPPAETWEMTKNGKYNGRQTDKEPEFIGKRVYDGQASNDFEVALRSARPHPQLQRKVSRVLGGPNAPS